MTDFDADFVGYLDSCRLAGLAERTIEEYQDQLRKYNQWCLNEGLNTLTVAAAKGYLVATQRRTVYGASMGSRAIKSFGRFIANEYDEPDPFASLRYVPPPKPGPQRTCTPVDVEQLLLVVAGTDLRSRRDHAIINMLWSTAARRSEVAGLRWSDIDLAVGTVRFVKTKNGDVRTARLTPDALRSLRRYKRAFESSDLGFRRGGAQLWFSTTGQAPLTSNAIGQMVQSRAKAAGIDVSSHSFRRGAAVRWLRAGGSETLLRQQAGWRTTTMVQRYVGQLADELALAEHKRLFG